MFRFTIRDVLWLTVVVGLAVALWQSRSELIQEKQNTIQWASRSNAALHVVRQSGTTAEWFNNGIIINETDAATGKKRVDIFVGNPK